MAGLRSAGWPRERGAGKLHPIMPSSSELSARLSAIPAPIQGALYMTGAALCFSLMNALIRLSAAELHPFVIAFFRNVFALLVMLPWLAQTGLKSLRTKRLGMLFGRSIIGLMAMLTWFTAVTILPLSEAVALNFSVPLFATIGAAIFLGEIVRARRWSATVIGFIGVLIILRPGFAEITPAMSLPIIAAVFMATSVLFVKSLSNTDKPGTIVLWMVLFLTPLSLIPALFFWSWPSWTTLAYLAGLGSLASVAHIALTRAYTKADASAITVFDYTRLPFIAVIAYIMFGEEPDLWTWVGAAVIATSTIYIARREAQVARERTASLAASESARGRL